MFEFEKDFELELGHSSLRRSKEKLVLIWNISGDEDTGGITSSPFRYKDTLIFGCMDKHIYSLNIETGKIIWKFRMNKGLTDARAVENEGIIYLGSFDTNIYAIDAGTGKEIWRFRAGGRIYGSCAIDKGRVYFGSEDSFVYALDAKTGKEIWRFRTGAEVGSAPKIHKNVVYIGSYDDNLYAIDASTGREVWRFKAGGNICNPLPFFIEDGIIYISSIDGNIYALDTERKREVWRFKTGGWMLASPKPVGDYIYFISSDGNMYCLSKEGRLVWRFMTETYLDGSPEVLVHDGILYYGSSNHNLYALDARTGGEKWRFRTDGIIISCPLVHEGKLYFGSCDCHLYCLSLEGKEMWRFQTSSKNIWKPPPESELFEFEVDIPKEEVEEAKKEYGSSLNFAEAEAIESEYSLKSEYQTKSEYKTESEYK